MVQLGKDKEMIGFPSAGLLSETQTSAPAKTEEDEDEDEDYLPAIAPMTVGRGGASRGSFTGAVLAR